MENESERYYCERSWLEPSIIYTITSQKVTVTKIKQKKALVSFSQNLEYEWGWSRIWKLIAFKLSEKLENFDTGYCKAGICNSKMFFKKFNKF